MIIVTVEVEKSIKTAAYSFIKELVFDFGNYTFIY